jgi:GTP cyclohydrolase I
MDEAKIKKAIRDLLEAIGEDPEREGIRQTPERFAEMCKEIFSSYIKPIEAPPVYFQTEKYSEIILVKDIEFQSMCEHHLLPFYGKAHIAYIPRDDKQERLTEVVADMMVQNLDPLGAMVVIEAQHMCMIMRGVKKPGSKVITSAMRGIFLSDARTRSEALALINRKSV